MRGFRDDDNAKPARLADVAAIVKRETEKAWLLDAGDCEGWIPKSQAENNGDGTFTMPEWLATERGFL